MDSCVGMIRHASSKDTRAECPTYGLVEIGTTLIVVETFVSAEGANFYGERGVRDHATQKISKSESLKAPFPALSGIFFLTLTERALSSAVIYFDN